MRQLLMIHRSAIAVCLAVALIMSTTVTGDASRIHALKVEKKEGASSFVISKMGAVEVQEFVMENPPRLVLDFIGAEHGLEQNQFEGDGQFVSQVRTSQFTNEPDRVSRVVFDLMENVAYEVKNGDLEVTVRFFAKNSDEPIKKPKTMASSMGHMEDAATPHVEPITHQNSVGPGDGSGAPEKTSPPSLPVRNWENPSANAPQQAQVNTKSDEGTSPQQNTNPAPMPTWSSTSAETNAMPSLQSFAANSGLASNKTITIDVQNADIKTVLRSMSEFSGTNIISGPEVEGKVTAHLKNVPWRHALDIVLKSHGFGWRDEYGVIRVSTMERLTKEELELQEAERRKDSLLPLVTRIIPLSYANANEIKQALQEVLTDRGSMEVEGGVNSLVVTDIEKNVDKISAMVSELDRKIKQVEIVAKMVDVDFEASQEMGIRWDVLNLSINNASAVGDAVIDARSATPTGTFRVGTVQSWGQVQGIVDMLARDNKANIISNPRIVTADNREASILVGKEIPLIVADEAGNPITELTKVGIILRVTPHVNMDESITLDLHPEVSELSSQATVQGGVVISLSEADTRLVVHNGETAVLGGLINEVESELENGVPLLKDLPLVGSFFKLKNTTKKKRELIIFVTPRIVDSAMASTE